jgi:hypothetical protein
VSKIFVIFEFISGIGIRGFMRVSNFSIISKVSESNFTKAISIILSFLLSSQVVSRSSAIICIFIGFLKSIEKYYRKKGESCKKDFFKSPQNQTNKLGYKKHYLEYLKYLLL